MKATRQIEYAEKRQRRLNEHEKAEIRLAKHNATRMMRKFIALKVDEKLTIQVSEEKYQKYGREKCIEMWQKKRTA